MLFHYYADKRTNDLVVAISKITGENKSTCFEILHSPDRLKNYLIQQLFCLFDQD